MSLELLFLGTGTSAGVPMIGCTCRVCRSADPRDNRSRPSVLISYPDTTSRAEVGAGKTAVVDPDQTAAAPPDGVKRFLVDTSSDMRTQVIRHDIRRVDAILYTHAHADHIFGVDDLRRFNAVMKSSLDVYGEPHTIETIKRMVPYIFDATYNPNNSFVASLVVKHIAPNVPVELYGAKWTPLRLMHGKLPILGFRVDFAGRSLAYCTDVSHIPDETAAMLTGLDVFVVDGLRHVPHVTHFSIDQALEQIRRVKPRQAYLTHMCHEVMHAETDASLPAGVNLSYDGLKVTLAGA